MARSLGVAGAILLSLERLFKLDNVTRIASVELWVLLTTVLLVARFVIDFQGPWFGNPRRTFIVLTLEALNQNLVIYTMGLMQLSGARKVNDYFQVWAVLLVTLQYSVKIGRPYTRSKQIPLLDLMSSFWSANLLRVQTFYLLRFPLWTIWLLNAVRIIMLFSSSGKGETNNQESMRLVADYMSYEHTLSASTSTLDEPEQNTKPAAKTMSGYKYLVYGEHRVLKQVQEGSKPEGKIRQQAVKSESSSSSYKIELKPDRDHKAQLVTIETIWKDDNGSGLLGAGDVAGRRRDLCLSFALYKLLRRGFYDLPMHELDRPAGKKKMRRLVFNYILKDHERAFRITGEELSFLRDLLYSKHATVFSGGLWVPLWSLLLSLCLATATGYIAYPVRYIPERMDPVDRNRITHGVFITRVMVGIIVLKEMLEIVLYLWSRWAKVLMLCMYAQLQPQHRRREAAMRRFVLCFGALSSMLRVLCRPFSFCCCKHKPKLWEVPQQNLLVKVSLLRLGPLPPMTMRKVTLRGQILGTAVLEDDTKDAILKQLRRLDSGEEGISIDSCFTNAFGSSEPNTGEKKVEWPRDLIKEADSNINSTHIILVWHIATSLCEIYSFDEVKRLRAAERHPLRTPFLPRPCTNKGPSSAVAPPAQQHDNGGGGSTESACWWYEEYATAVTLSNYCVYLVSEGLVPDNRLVARKVLDEVIREIDYVVAGVHVQQQREKLLQLEDVHSRLMKTVDGKHRRQGRSGHTDEEDNKDDDDEEEDIDILCSLTRMGAVLAKDLTEVYHDGDEAKGRLWRGLGNFWTGFLLYLAANTGAATHGRHLAGDSELITHLWALLTHAGYGGNADHGEQGLDPDGIPDINQQAS